MKGIAGICIAAGASTRMGRPKALLEYGGRGRTGAEIALASLAGGGGDDPVVLVIGADAEAIRRAALILPVGTLVIENAGWEAGRTGSIQAGLAAAPTADAYVILPVDHPLVVPADVAALVEAWRGAAGGGPRRRRRIGVVRVEHGGRGGHPILFDAGVAEEVRALAPDAPLRDVIRAHLHRDRETVVRGSPGVLVNVDTPEDYHRAAAASLTA